VAWKQSLREICENLDLQAEGLAPNCRTGAITLGDRLFEASTSPQLSEEGMRKVQLAVPILLEIGKERVEGSAIDLMLDEAAQELIAEATKGAP